MPPKKRDITKYSNYFMINTPNSQIQAVLILLLGVFAGATASLVVHSGDGTGKLELAAIGASAGILVISVPAFLTLMALKLEKRKMMTKRAMFAVLAISMPYAGFIILNAVLYYFLRNDVLAYVILILSNASIYGYWFMINKVAFGQRRSAIVTSEIQPVANILMYLPFGGYLLNIGVPLNVALAKLFGGMLVFLVMGYTILYLLDRPAKKSLYVSSVQLFSTMVGQWLYDLNADTKILGSGGVERNIRIDVMSLSTKRGYKAIVVRPDMHYGPFGTVGGSIFTELLGNAIVSKYGATPFIIHGAVNIEDNPISTKQVGTMSNRICEFIETLRARGGSDAYGALGFGKDGQCRAINLRINGVNLLTLSKAPSVTEDIDREVGMEFERVADMGLYKTMLIDAHNSRFETAPKDDLKGIYKGSRYIGMYENAIRHAVTGSEKARMKLGVSHMKLSKVLHNDDLGKGYTSLGIFGFGKKMFAILYIDANNMLPGFRQAVIGHLKSKYMLDAELCSTDTHAVNSIALTARNSLGRYTRTNEIMPLIDAMVDRALKNMEPVRCSYGSLEFKKFKVWGSNAEELINRVGMDIINVGKHVVPLIIVGAFIIAGWIIYII